MLSSIASFLPSALHLNNNTTQEYQQVGPTINPDTEDEDDEVPRNYVQQQQQQQQQEVSTTEGNGQPQGAKGAAKSAYETFIFVRPPPSKSNHPLNLQVQLVPPHGRPPTGVANQDDAITPTSARSRSSSNADGNTGTTSLVRTNSKRSEVYIVNDTPNTTPTSATTNTNASTSSFASTASFTFSTASSSSSGGRRTIIPLYNLQAHNVMTNVIVDAGTDAKIARFQKRGIEMMEVGVLEPVEVWGEKERGSQKRKKRDSLRLSVDEAASTSTWAGVKLRNSFLQPGGGSRPATPSATSSKTSLHSSSHSNLRMASPAPVLAAAFPVAPPADQQQPPILDSTTPTPMPQTQTQVQFMPQSPPQKRNIFNKLFNKRSSLVAPPLPPPLSSEPEPTFSTFSLHPAPVPNKLIVVQNVDRRKSKTPVAAPPPLPPLTLGSPPQSPSSQTSQMTTPRQTQTPKLDLGTRNDEEDDEDGLVSPTPTVAPPKERGHGRNSSLTVPFMNNPFKTTLIRSGKNRLSAVVGGGGGGADKEKEKEKEKEEKGKREERKEEKEKEKQRVSSSSSSSNFLLQKRDASPANLSVKRGSRSQLSLHGGGGSNAELNGGAPLMLTQSQAREELSTLKQQQLALRPPVLGIQPTFVSSAVALPSNPLGSVASPLVAALSPRMSDTTQENLLVGQRALMYVWLVRKWLKRRPVVEGEGGLVFGELGRFGGFNLKGNNAPSLGYGGVEVRFEWKRTKTKGGKEGRKGRRGRASTGTTAGVESDDEVAARPTEREMRGSVSSNVKERLLDKRRNRMSTGSFSTTTASDDGGGGEGSIRGRARPRREGTIDDGEESDPEDSETPWVCTLKIRRMATAATDLISPPASAFSDGGFPKSAVPSHPPQIMRLKVGTLSPTPHHPKVVAMLKVPFPLPDVEVERMGVVRRKGFASQQEQGGEEGEEEEEGREPYYGLTLTAEEIKDIVCSTGLWLVVREGFGGVGRVSRKGDGWRIRA